MIEGEFKQGMRLEVQKKTKKDIRHKVRQSEHCRLETEVKLQALAKQLNTHSGKLQNCCDPYHQLCVRYPEQFPRQAIQIHKSKLEDITFFPQSVK